jgi:O-antigen/teichoic acid export membrane protein
MDSEKTHAEENKQDEILTVAKGGGISLIGSITARIINYVYSTALIWGLGAESYGLFTLALAISTFVGVVSNLGLPYGIVRFGSIRAQEQGRAGIHQTTMAAIRVTLPISVISSLFLFWNSSLISDLVFHKPGLTPIIRTLAICFPFMTIQSTFLAGTRALKMVKYSVLVWVIQPLAALLLAIPMLMSGWGISTISLAYVVSYILGAALSVYFHMRLIAQEFRVKEKFPVGKMVKFSIPLSLTQWMHYINERTEIFFLGLLPSAIDVGIYNIAWRIAGLETVFHLSIDNILGPISSDLSHHQNISKLNIIYKTTTKWTFTCALLLFLIFSFSSVTIMNVFDPLYVTGAGVLVLLGFAQLINAATGSCNTILIMSGYSYLSLLNTILLFAVSIALDLLLIPPYALAGAAIAGTLAVILVNILRVMEVWIVLKIHPFKRSFAKPIIAGILGLVSVHLLRMFVYSGGLLIDVGFSALLGLIYVALIYFLKLDSDDKLVLEAIAQRIRRFHWNQKGVLHRSSSAKIEY